MNTPLNVYVLARDSVPKPPREHPAEAAISLLAASVLDALLEADSSRWRDEFATAPATLDERVGLLARLSREALAWEKFRQEARENDKPAPTRQEFESVEPTLNL